MENSEPLNYLSISEYEKLINVLNQFSKSILVSYAECSSETKDRIIRDFISRSITSLNGLMQLWRIEDYHSCWLIHRSIVDRLFYLESIGNNNEFQLYDDWSFIKVYRYKQKCNRDETLVRKTDSTHFIITDEDTKRYKKILKNKTRWKPPRAHKVASSICLDILYHGGYHFASMYVHPLARREEEAYARLVGKPVVDSCDDQITVIHNSCLVTLYLIVKGIIFSKLKWYSGVFTFLDDMKLYISEGSERYLVSLLRIKRMLEDGSSLCQKTIGSK